MASSYIPAGNGAFDAWLLNFSTLITVSPPTYGLTPGDAVTIAGYYSLWHPAYLLAHDPATKTRVTVANRDAIRAAISVSIRGYAQQIKADLGVLNSDKIALGLNPPNSARSPVPPPTTNPLLEILCVSPGATAMRYQDSAAAGLGRKPFGAVACQLYRALGADVVGDPTLMDLVGSFTRKSFMVESEANEAGQIASYAGRWITRKGLVGPWSPVVSSYLV